MFLAFHLTRDIQSSFHRLKLSSSFSSWIFIMISIMRQFALCSSTQESVFESSVVVKLLKRFSRNIAGNAFEGAPNHFKEFLLLYQKNEWMRPSCFLSSTWTLTTLVTSMRKMMSKQRASILLFTCTRTRAVHLELTQSMA